MNCDHLHDGKCANPAATYHGQVVHLACRRCPHYSGKPRGLGDTVARVTKAVGIPPCGGCAQRLAALNAAVPYRGAESPAKPSEPQATPPTPPNAPPPQAGA